MKAGTDLAQIGSLVGDPARANMLAALMGGAALTASELALEAGVSLSTASAHLAKLSDGGLIRMARQGRHRYYALADQRVAAMLENIMGVAAALGPKRVLPGPRDKAMREARICYDHLAGEAGVAMLDSFAGRGLIRIDGESAALSEDGAAYFTGLGIDLDALGKGRRAVCRTCLDWSVRPGAPGRQPGRGHARPHTGARLGTARKGKPYPALHAGRAAVLRSVPSMNFPRPRGPARGRGRMSGSRSVTRPRRG